MVVMSRAPVVRCGRARGRGCASPEHTSSGEAQSRGHGEQGPVGDRRGCHTHTEDVALTPAPARTQHRVEPVPHPQRPAHVQNEAISVGADDTQRPHIPPQTRYFVLQIARYGPDCLQGRRDDSLHHHRAGGGRHDTHAPHRVKLRDRPRGVHWLVHSVHILLKLRRARCRRDFMAPRGAASSAAA